VPEGAAKLFGEEMIPVCSRALVRDKAHPLKRPQDLAHHTLLHFDYAGAEIMYMDWGTWLTALGMELSEAIARSAPAAPPLEDVDEECATSVSLYENHGNPLSQLHYDDSVGKLMSKSELILTIVEEHSNKLTRKDVKEVLESLANVGYKELKKTGAFLVPGFAKFIVVRKPATKARKGVNPFTKEPMVFKAKPARKVLKARPVKAAKDALA